MFVANKPEKVNKATSVVKFIGLQMNCAFAQAFLSSSGIYIKIVQIRSENPISSALLLPNFLFLARHYVWFQGSFLSKLQIYSFK